MASSEGDEDAFGGQGSALHPQETFLKKGFLTSKNFGKKVME
jgi:hypothetical protein